MQQFSAKDHANGLINNWYFIISLLTAIGKVDSSLLHGATSWDIKVRYQLKSTYMKNWRMHMISF